MTDNSSQGGHQVVKDDLEHPTTPTRIQPRSIELEYPELPLHLSLNSLLAHSASTSASPTRTTMPPADADHRSLDSSWASLGGDESSSEDDLQSEHTDVGSLLDVHSSDDVRSVADGVNTDNGESTDEEDLGDTLTEELDQGHILGPYVQHELPDRIPSSTTPQQDDVKETISRSVNTYTTSRQLLGPEAQRLRPLHDRGVKPAEYFSVIRMPILDEGVDLNTYNYFKVLLLGRQVEQFRSEIQRKLGDVLVLQAATCAQSQPSSVARFHLVPNTFGPGAEPDYADLVAIDKQIDFDCYDLVTSTKDPGPGSQLVLRNSQTGTEMSSTWNGSRFVVGNPRWTIPDLAVICVHLGQGNIMDRDSYSMLSFAERHSIPHVVVRMDRGWHGHYDGAVISDSLHETIEAQHNESQWTASHMLPIDIAAFLNLNAARLNSHLAYVVSTAGEGSPIRPETPSFKAEKPSAILDILPRLNASLLKNVFMVLWVIGVYTFLGYQLWPIWSDPPILGANSGDVVASVGAEQPIHITPTQLLPQVPCASPFTAGKSVHVAHQIVDVASMKVGPVVPDDTQHFQVGVAGDNQLLVKLPKVALDHKKRAPLSIELRRKNQTVPAAVQELFEGVFSVQLLPHDAYGDIEVDLTMTKPLLSETLTVSFGDRHDFKVQRMRELWSTLRDHIRRKVLNVSSSLENVVERRIVNPVQTRLQTFMCQANERSGLRRLKDRDCWETSRLSELLKNIVYPTVARDAQAVRNRIVQYKEDCVKEAKVLAAVLSTGYSEARSVSINWVRSVNPMQVRPKIDTAAIVDKLETARGRARRIVSDAAKNLRASNDEA